MVRSRPLDPEERERFLSEIEERGELLDEVIGRGLLYTGVVGTTLAHIRAEWLHETPRRLELRIPPGEIECVTGGMKGSTIGKVTGEPCAHCQKFDGVWKSRQYRPRRIPIGDERTQEAFRQWFSLYDVVGTSSIIETRMEKYADWTGIERLSPGVLRRTFAVILVEKRFPVDVCSQLLGFRSQEKGEDRVRRYAKYADGGTPFVCGATTSRYGECSRPVKTLDGRCYSHRDA